MWCALVMDWQYPKVCISWRKNGLLNEVEQGFSSFLIDLMIFFKVKNPKSSFLVLQLMPKFGKKVMEKLD